MGALLCAACGVPPGAIFGNISKLPKKNHSKFLVYPHRISTDRLCESVQKAMCTTTTCLTQRSGDVCRVWSSSCINRTLIKARLWASASDFEEGGATWSTGNTSAQWPFFSERLRLLSYLPEVRRANPPSKLGIARCGKVRSLWIDDRWSQFLLFSTQQCLLRGS